jgi:cysteine desulfurase family protein (TIGR01976 family)
MEKLDIEFVRNQFPAFSEKSLFQKAFFENAGGSFMCQQVIDRFDRYFRQRKVQPYGFYEASKLAGEEMDSSRQRMAEYLNVNTDEVLFGPSTSQNTYVLAHAFLEKMSNQDEIIISDQEHEANAGAWHRMADRGIKVKIWTIDPDTGSLDIKELKNLITEKTKFIAATHCSNVVGEINPIKEISEIARSNGSLLIVDGVSYCPHGLPDVNDLGADIYFFSAYKTYGPHQGVMVIREKAKQALTNQSHFFNADYSDKFMVPAGPDHAQVAACNGILDYFDLIDQHHFSSTDKNSHRTDKPRRVANLFRNHEIELLKPLLEFLNNSKKVKLIGPGDNVLRAPTVAFVPKNKMPEEVANELASHNIMAGAGDFYAVRPLMALGIDPKDGVVRLSFVHYNTKNEINSLINALEKTL